MRVTYCKGCNREWEFGGTEEDEYKKRSAIVRECYQKHLRKEGDCWRFRFLVKDASEQEVLLK